MTRFVLTLTEAAQTIIESENFARGGDIIIKKMPKLKIIDLIRAVYWVHAGPAERMKHRIVGKRKAEKLHEELIAADELLNTQEYEDYLIIRNDPTCLNKDSFNIEEISSSTGPHLSFKDIEGILHAIRTED